MSSLEGKFFRGALTGAAMGLAACNPQENSHTQREVQIASAQSSQQEKGPAIIDEPQSEIDAWHGETDELIRRKSLIYRRPIVINVMSDQEFDKKHPDGAIRPYEPK